MRKLTRSLSWAWNRSGFSLYQGSLPRPLLTPLTHGFFPILWAFLAAWLSFFPLATRPIAYYNQVVGFVSWEDLAGGLVKCFVFGLLIAATGCIRGYQTLRGPSAVGDATTRAVVSSIILIAVFDGIFFRNLLLSGHMNETIISVRHLFAGYNNNAFMEDLNFDIQSGEVFVILGGSGCGKSTVLKTHDRPGARRCPARSSSMVKI